MTDARLLLLPIRSLSGNYRWVTCPYILERLERDWQLVDRSLKGFHVRGKVQNGQALVAQNMERLFLEEFSFEPVWDEEAIHLIAEEIAPLVRHPSVSNRLKEQLAVVSDEEFAHFARYALPIQTRNHLDDVTKTSKNLWTEETLPPDTVMYSIVLARPGQEKLWEELKALLEKNPYLQAGGNETVGQGWFVTTVIE